MTMGRLPGASAKAGELGAVLVASAILTVALTWPLAARIGRIGRVDNADGQFSIWNVAWVARAIVVSPTHLFDANIFYPNPDTLAYSESNLGAGLVASPVYWATKNPFAAHNVAVLFAFFVSGVAMYYLVRHVAGDPRAAAIAAVAYAFCPYIYARTSHIQLLMIGGLPLVLLALHRLVDRPSASRGAALGLAMALQALFCGYYGIFAILIVGFGVIVMATLRRLWASAALWKGLVAGAVVSVAIVIPAFVPYMRLQGQGFGRSLEAAASFSANWSAYLASSSHAHVWMLSLIPKPSESLFPGFVALVCGIGGAWTARLDRRSELLWMYGGLAVLACWASLGPRGQLYSVLYHVVPVFSWMRAPARFGLVVTLALCVLAGIGLSRWLPRTAVGSAIALVLTLATAGELATAWPMRPVEPLEPVYRALARLPPGPVIEMPFWYLDFMFPRHTYYMLQSARGHWMPLVNGYSDYMPPDFLDHVMTLAAFPSRESLKLLEPQHVRYAIVHRYWYGDDTWATVVPRMQELAPYLKPLYKDEGTQLYEIVGFPP
jgi:hypothetical protein